MISVKRTYLSCVFQSLQFRAAKHFRPEQQKSGENFKTGASLDYIIHSRSKSSQSKQLYYSLSNEIDCFMAEELIDTISLNHHRSDQVYFAKIWESEKRRIRFSGAKDGEIRISRGQNACSLVVVSRKFTPLKISKRVISREIYLTH